MDVIQDLKQRIEAELEPGEQVVYAGRPDWRAARSTLIAVFALGLFMCAVAMPIACATMAAVVGIIPFSVDGEPASPFLAAAFCLLAVPVAALAAFVLSVPFLSIVRCKRAAHAVTDRRFLTVFAGGKPEVESHPLDSVNFVTRKSGGGWGSLEIAYGVEKDADGNPRPLTVTWSGIPDLNRAEAALLRRD